MTPIRLPESPPVLDARRFEGQIDGQQVALYTLRNTRGMVACITNYGAKIEQLLVPDRHGQQADVLLGYDSLQGAVVGSPSMGAFIGRYAGRLANASFQLDGQRYQLGANNGPHCLHGGIRGSRLRVFDAVQRGPSCVEMQLVFADGEEGFPGMLTLNLNLSYSVSEANEFVIAYQTLAHDRSTVGNFTTHGFFNLDGHASGSVLGHEVTIYASRLVGMTPDLIATGELLQVAGTPFDFRQATALVQRMNGQLAAGAKAEGPTGQVAGYDCCYVVDRPEVIGALALCARFSAPKSGRVMEVWSSEPALQFYTGLVAGEALTGGLGKGGTTYLQQQSFCVEPQGYPNAPNLPQFPSARYVPGSRRRGQTVYTFSNRSS